MPKFVDDLVEELLSDPKFYPEKSEKAQKATAYAIAWSQYNKSKKKKKTKKKASEYKMSVRIGSTVIQTR